MTVDITGHHLKVTDSLRDKVNQTAKRINRHLDSPVQRMHVVLEVSNNIHRCDIQFHAGNEHFVAAAEAADMYSAIDKSADKIERQMQKAKNRQLARRQQ